MTAVDIAIVLVWSIVVLGLGIFAGIRSNLESFWVNDRKTTTFALVSTIVATQVGGGAIIGITSSSYAKGTGFGLVALISTVSGFLVIAWLAPWAKAFGDKYRAFTLPEVIGKRFGRSSQIVTAAIIVVAYISLLAGQILSAVTLIKSITGVPSLVALVITAAGMVIYSAYAGLRGDIVTDKLNLVIMAIFLFCIIAPVMMAKFPVMALLSEVPSELWSPVTFGGSVYLVGGVLLGAIIPVVSMEMWMRVYAARGGSEARRSFLWSAVIVIPFYLLPLFLGLLASQLQLTVQEPDDVFVKLMFEYLPSGLLGISVAGLLAVIVSTSNTMILVIAAAIYRDVLGRGRIEEGARELTISRTTTLLVGLCGLGFTIIVPSVVQLVLNAFFMIAIIGPVLAGIFLWKRATAKGAFSSLIAGGVTTIGFLPIAPTQAFVPGLLVAIGCFVAVSLFTSHSTEENLTL